METVEQAGGIAVIGDRVVVRRTSRGDWVFPKGHVEPGETLEQAAVREMGEETGLKTAVVGEAGEIRFQQDGQERRVRFFLVRVTGYLSSWPEHLGTDTFLVSGHDASRLLSFENTRRLWDGIKERALGGAENKPSPHP